MMLVKSPRIASAQASSPSLILRTTKTQRPVWRSEKITEKLLMVLRGTRKNLNWFRFACRLYMPRKLLHSKRIRLTPPK